MEQNSQNWSANSSMLGMLTDASKMIEGTNEVAAPPLSVTTCSNETCGELLNNGCDVSALEVLTETIAAEPRMEELGISSVDYEVENDDVEPEQEAANEETSQPEAANKEISAVIIVDEVVVENSRKILCRTSNDFWRNRATPISSNVSASNSPDVSLPVNRSLSYPTIRENPYVRPQISGRTETEMEEWFSGGYDSDGNEALSDVGPSPDD